MRFVIVHYHIFKNGGSTIEAILERAFGPKFGRLHGPHADSTLDGSDLLAFLRENPRFSAVTSHHLRYPKPSARETVLFDCCFLRHPLDRIHSAYLYFRRVRPEGDPVCVLAHRTTPREFAVALIEDFPHMVSDVQTMLLGNAGAFTRPAGAADLERAIAILDDMAIPGLVEMFNESLVAAEYFLKPAFPSLKFEYVLENVSRRAARQGVRREQELTSAWGADVYQELMRLNQFDLKLFERAQREIRRRIDLVPRAKEKLEVFQLRCERLQVLAS